MAAEKSVYKQIALDIAQGIAAGRFRMGDKLRGRSTLAGQYNVSPETIRRAVALLETAEVLEVVPSEGIIIRSAEAAQDFVDRAQDLDSINSIRASINQLLEQQEEISRRLTAQTRELLDAAGRFNYLNPLTPYELEITGDCRQQGRTIGDLNFWNNTQATIIAIKRGEKLLLSPGPYAVLGAGDKLLIVGDDTSYHRAKAFLYGEEPVAGVDA